MDPEDPTVIAENELLGAAAAIEAAAKKLEQLKPRAKPKVRPPPSVFPPLLGERAHLDFASLSATFVRCRRQMSPSTLRSRYWKLPSPSRRPPAPW